MQTNHVHRRPNPSRVPGARFSSLAPSWRVYSLQLGSHAPRPNDEYPPIPPGTRPSDQVHRFIVSYPFTTLHFFFFWENLLPNRNRLFENNLVEILYNFVVVKVSRIEFNVNVQRFVNMILKNDTCIYMIVFSLER